ncbi:MAG: hypothetical protein ACRBHB_12510 [Arenicella sp.]
MFLGCSKNDVDNDDIEYRILEHLIDALMAGAKLSHDQSKTLNKELKQMLLDEFGMSENLADTYLVTARTILNHVKTIAKAKPVLH